MALPPLTVTLSDGQKAEALKRMRKQYADQMEKIVNDLTTALTSHAEAEFLAAYLGEQPEIKELRLAAAKATELEAKRQYLGKVLERLDAVLPAPVEVNVPVPSGAPKAGGLRKF